ADRPRNPARFLILGSASPDIVKRTSESLAGRVEFVELGGFDLLETGAGTWKDLWLRGGLPRSYLSRSDTDRHG
ncbi:MAG: ATPase, partial [Desulfobacterales bacterium]|nr:ATPase [Desulfobacterales bacterium]